MQVRYFPVPVEIIRAYMRIKTEKRNLKKIQLVKSFKILWAFRSNFQTLSISNMHLMARRESAGQP